MERLGFILRAEHLPYIIILFLCLISRLLSSISYYEDPEALRLSLIALESNLNVLQSTAPVICFAVKVLDYLLNNIGLNFAALGGFSAGVIIIYCIRLLRVPPFSLEGGLAAFMLFFNPLLWLMSNSYLPYMAGCALTIAALFYTIEDYYNRGSLNIGFLLTGLLAGVVLQFILIPFIPGIYYVIKRKQYKPLLFFPLGLAIWLIPSLWVAYASFPQFINSQSTFFTQGNNMAFFTLIRSLWADGMGGYWLDRQYFLVINMLPLLSFLFFGLLVIMGFGKEQEKIYLYGSVVGLYLLFTLCQSARFYTGLVLPIIPLMAITAAYGIIYFLVNFNMLQIKLVIFIYMGIIVYFAVGTAIEHTQPTAIAQLENYLSNDEYSSKGLTILCTDTNIISYLKKESPAKFYAPKAYNFQMPVQGKLVSVNDSLGRKYTNSVTFVHNPYINHNYTDLILYEY